MSDTVAGDDCIYQHGDNLPSFTIEIEELKSTFHTMISTMQDGISNEISKIKESVSQLNQHIADV